MKNIFTYLGITIVVVWITIILFVSAAGIYTYLKGQEIKYHFTATDSTYFNAYDSGIKYLFKTNKGTDTLIIKEKFCHDDYTPWYKLMFSKDGGLAHFRYEGVFYHNHVNKDFYCSINKTTYGYDPRLFFAVGGLFFMSSEDTTNTNYREYGMYKDVIIIDTITGKKNIYEYDPKCDFEYIHWD